MYLIALMDIDSAPIPASGGLVLAKPIIVIILKMIAGLGTSHGTALGE
jgi:hypothetical protein